MGILNLTQMDDIATKIIERHETEAESLHTSIILVLMAYGEDDYSTPFRRRLGLVD